MKTVILASILTLSGCAQTPHAKVPAASSPQTQAVVLDIDAPPQPTVLPPRYLFIPQFKDCLKTQTIGSYQAWCMPQDKPQSCPANSWEQLLALQGRDRISLCHANTATP